MYLSIHLCQYFSLLYVYSSYLHFICLYLSAALFFNLSFHWRLFYLATCLHLFCIYQYFLFLLIYVPNKICVSLSICISTCIYSSTWTLTSWPIEWLFIRNSCWLPGTPRLPASVQSKVNNIWCSRLTDGVKSYYAPKFIQCIFPAESMRIPLNHALRKYISQIMHCFTSRMLSHWSKRDLNVAIRYSVKDGLK